MSSTCRVMSHHTTCQYKWQMKTSVLLCLLWYSQQKNVRRQKKTLINIYFPSFSTRCYSDFFFYFDTLIFFCVTFLLRFCNIIYASIVIYCYYFHILCVSYIKLYRSWSMIKLWKGFHSYVNHLVFSRESKKKYI